MTAPRSLAFVLLALLVWVATVASVGGCTTGTTPDCSGDAAAACGQAVPESGVPLDTGKPVESGGGD